LGFEDQDRQIRLIGGRQEQAIEPVFPFLQHRGAEYIPVHLRQQFSHQRLDPLGVLLEQPVEEFVAGYHGEGADASSSRRCHVQAMVINGGALAAGGYLEPQQQPIGFSAMMEPNAQKGSGARRALPMP